jgi:hypothetical protein
MLTSTTVNQGRKETVEFIHTAFVYISSAQSKALWNRPEQAKQVNADCWCIPDKTMKLPSSIFPNRIAAQPTTKNRIVGSVFVEHEVGRGVRALGRET